MIPFCINALKIHEIELGRNSVEVANSTRLLRGGLIFNVGLEVHENALGRLNCLKKSFELKNYGLNSNLHNCTLNSRKQTRMERDDGRLLVNFCQEIYNFFHGGVRGIYDYINTKQANERV